MDDTSTATLPETEFELHGGRGRFNALFFRVMGPYLERRLHGRKQRLFAGLPQEVVEIGTGVGANLPYLPAGARLVAIEPNRYMHGRLRAEASRYGLELDLRERMAEKTGLPDQSVDSVISSLVLCSVQEPDAVLAEIRRILKPGGTFRFVEHVVAESGTPTRAVQRTPPSTVGLDVRRLLVRTRPGRRRARRRFRPRHRGALSAPHPVPAVQPSDRGGSRGLRCGQRAPRRRRAIAIPISARPTTRTIGPTVAHTEEPLIAEPGSTLNPCRVHTSPAPVRMTPGTRNGQMRFTTLSLRR